jgi:hypothetical protein
MPKNLDQWEALRGLDPTRLIALQSINANDMQSVEGRYNFIFYNRWIVVIRLGISPTMVKEFYSMAFNLDVLLTVVIKTSREAQKSHSLYVVV